MKKITLLFVGVLMSAFTFAGPDEKPSATTGIAVVKKDESSFKLIYKSEEATDVKIQIFNKDNDLVYFETIRKSNGFSRPYNFAGLEKGEYTIKLDNGSNWMSETFSVGKSEKLAQLIHLNDGKYLLTVAGKGEDKLTIRVADEQGKTINTESIPVYGDFAQVYDMGNVNGVFTIEVTDSSGATKTLTK